MSTPGGPLFWASVVVGWGIIAYGIVGVFDNAVDTHPRSLAIWLVGSLAFHDVLIAPAVFIFAGAMRRAIRPPFRAVVQGALVVTAALVIISVPVVGGFGRLADNPSALPRNYVAGMLGSLGIVWVATGVALVLAWRRSRRT